MAASSFAPIVVGTAAPDFTRGVAGGPDVSLSALRGHPVLLASFADAWDPARPHLLASYNALLRGVPGGGQVVSVARDDCWCDLETDDGKQFRFALVGHDPRGISPYRRARPNFVPVCRACVMANRGSNGAAGAEHRA
jgi:peroxiredoxin